MTNLIERWQGGVRQTKGKRNNKENPKEQKNSEQWQINFVNCSEFGLNNKIIKKFYDRKVEELNLGEKYGKIDTKKDES